MSEPQWIASSEGVFVERNGTRIAGSTRISLPEPGEQQDAQCWYALDPVEKSRRIYGTDKLQALHLAIRMCAMELAMYEERGGAIEYPPCDGQDPGTRWGPTTTFGALFRLPDEPGPPGAPT